MTDINELVALFADKLAKTGSLDAALTKACWVAYKRGYADGSTTPDVILTPPKLAAPETP